MKRYFPYTAPLLLFVSNWFLHKTVEVSNVVVANAHDEGPPVRLPEALELELA